MEAFVQSILVNVAVCLYATLGFCLSVVASLLSLFGAKQATFINVPQKRPRLQHHGPSRRPTDRMMRICSEKSVPQQEQSISLQNRKKLLASHRRSRSIPVITVDHFGSIDNLRQKTDEIQSLTKPVRKPLTFVIPPAPDRLPTIASPSEKPAFRLVNLFSKEKENKHRNRERKLSSPDTGITRDSATLPASPRRRCIGDENTVPFSPTDALEQKLRKPVRRVSSAPAHAEEKLTMKFDLTFTRSVEKKKSSTLRTQPYEAPFFCPPPTLPRRSASTADLTSGKKSPRSWTLK